MLAGERPVDLAIALGSLAVIVYILSRFAVGEYE